MKHCTSCNTTKQVSEFYTNKSKIDGLHTECRECSKARKRAWAKDNLEKSNKYEC